MNATELKPGASFSSLFASTVLEPVLERRFFFGLGPVCIKNQNFLMIASALYERGAILGAAMVRATPRWSVTTLLAQFSLPKAEMGTIQEFATAQVARRLRSYKYFYKRDEPDNFFDLVIMVEVHEGSDPTRALWQNPGKKISLDQAQPQLWTFLVEGVTFGAEYSDLTERIVRSSYEGTGEPEKVRRWRDAGLRLPEKPKGASFETIQNVVLEIACWAASIAIPSVEFMFRDRLNQLQAPRARRRTRRIRRPRRITGRSGA